MENNIQLIQEKVQKEYPIVEKIFNELSKIIVGQKYLLERLLVGVLADGHILLEGVPGLAKTVSVNTLSKTIGTKFQRIQFTPDLLPADIMGTSIYNPKDGTFSTKKGPIFANIILADEINRAPSKVQSALLESMAEKQVTISGETFNLEEPFLVLATQNPIEQGGTYPLPEAQLDRFMLKLHITYPSRDEEKEILNNIGIKSIPEINQIVSADEIIRLRKLVREIYIDDKIKNYIVDIVYATRKPSEYGLEELVQLIAVGSSPRATLALSIAARAYAFLQGRGYVIPDDIKAIGHDILRHRIIVTYEAEAEEKTTDNLITKIFDKIDVP